MEFTASQIVAAIEEIAPLHYQESYDNAGFCVGNPQTKVTAALLCFDVTEAIIDEALQVGSNLIISHHPVIFKGLKQITGKTNPERIVEKAIKNNILLYAAHTNIDSVRGGVNEAIADKLQLQKRKILSTRKGECLKFVTFVPSSHAENLHKALFEAGAGAIGNYNECSWNTLGEGTFKANSGANPFVGTIGERHTEQEVRVETIVPRACLSKVVRNLFLAHPYEEPAYDIIPLENNFADVGSGMIGELPEHLSVQAFLQNLKTNFAVSSIRYSQSSVEKISCVAVCGGSGAFLINDALAAGAQAFISADFKYHDFVDADQRMLLVDIGHYESECGVMNIFCNCLTKKIPTFAVHLAKNAKNPINYLA